MGTQSNSRIHTVNGSPFVKLANLTLRVALVLALVISENSEEGNPEFFHACSGGELSTFKTLLEKNPSLVHSTTTDGEHCLHLSAITGNTEIVQTLLEMGADPDIRSKWEQGLRMHPLSWNTFWGRHEIIDLLLKHGADVNADFDIGKKRNGEIVKGTVLDVVEQILIGTEDAKAKERFVKTRNILVRNGAMRYASLDPDL